MTDQTAAPAASDQPRFPWRLYVAITLVASLWIHASENFRYLLFIRPMLHESLSMVPDVAPMTLPYFVSWGVWDTLLAAMTTLWVWLYARVFGASVRSAVIAGSLSWLASFVVFWHAFANLNLATFGHLVVDLPLSWLELTVAALIAHYGFGAAWLKRIVG